MPGGKFMRRAMKQQGVAMAQFGMVGKLVAHPGRRDELVELLMSGVSEVKKADGCELYVVSREVRDQASGVIQTPADYSQLGPLLIAQLLLGLALPFAAIVFAKVTRFKSA